MNLRRLSVVLMMLFILFTIGTNGFADEKKADVKEELITCPVSGNEVKKSEAVGPYNHKGTDYFFFCNGCLSKFKADPEKYLTTVLTVCNEKVAKNTALKSTYKDKEYYFCNEKCKAAFDKNPEAFLAEHNDTAGHDKKGCCSKTKCSSEKPCERKCSEKK